MRLILAIVTLFLVGCSTSTVTLIEKPASLNSHAPSNEKNQPGVVKYLHEGLAPSVRMDQQKKAEKIMSETCKGKYSVSEKGLNLVEDTPNSNRYWYIKFLCAK